MFLVSCLVPGFSAIPRNTRVYSESEELKLISRKVRPTKIYSDNGTTFVGAARWLRRAVCDEKFNRFLAGNEIVCQFNLRRAPWWGGQFERLLGLVNIPSTRL